MLHGLTSLLEKQPSLRTGPRIVLVTSAMSGEGKSMLSSALAASFCAKGRRVFMIECNPSAPSFGQWFPQCHTQASYNSEMEVLRYGSSNLFLLPANDLPSYEVSDLLDSYRGWINKAMPVVDWIILDGAPLLRDFADVAPLVPLATDILFVNDASRSTDGQTKAAFSLLKPMMLVDVLRGVVMNRERV
jgi:Mrp family chromosome partitioning ATPase